MSIVGRIRRNCKTSTQRSKLNRLVNSFFVILLVVCICRTFVTRASDNVEKLTLTIHTAIKSSGNPDLYNGNLWSRDCGGTVNVINNNILLLRNGTIDGHFIDAKRAGGDDVDSVMGQPEKDEFVKVQKGFISVTCDAGQFPSIHIPSAYDKLIKTINVIRSREHVSDVKHNSIESFTVLFERKDYANLYWTLIEIYNVFLTIKMFLRDPSQSNVLLLDVHPRGHLDEMWNMLFGNILRFKELKDKQWEFKELVFGFDTYGGPVTSGMDYLPFLSDFQTTIYRANRLGVPSIEPCHLGVRNLNVTLILRKDYVAHARNPTGKIMRKLLNENEIIVRTKTEFPFIKFTTVQLDDLSIGEQIKLMYHTDILIGVHGAGLGHLLLMRPRTGVIELFPTSYIIFRNHHFEDFATWAGMYYSSWYNTDIFLRDSEWLYVSPNVVVNLIHNMMRRVCQNTQENIYA